MIPLHNLRLAGFAASHGNRAMAEADQIVIRSGFSQFHADGSTTFGEMDETCEPKLSAVKAILNY